MGIRSDSNARAKQGLDKVPLKRRKAKRAQHALDLDAGIGVDAGRRTTRPLESPSKREQVKMKRKVITKSSNTRRGTRMPSP